MSLENNARGWASPYTHAWTVAYAFNPGKSWTLTLEWPRVTGSSYSWSEYLDRSGPITDTQAQLSVRYALGSTPY